MVAKKVNDRKPDIPPRERTTRAAKTAANDKIAISLICFAKNTSVYVPPIGGVKLYATYNNKVKSKREKQQQKKEVTTKKRNKVKVVDSDDVHTLPRASTAEIACLKLQVRNLEERMVTVEGALNLHKSFDSEALNQSNQELMNASASAAALLSAARTRPVGLVGDSFDEGHGAVGKSSRRNAESGPAPEAGAAAISTPGRLLDFGAWGKADGRRRVGKDSHVDKPDDQDEVMSVDSVEQGARPTTSFPLDHIGVPMRIQSPEYHSAKETNSGKNGGRGGQGSKAASIARSVRSPLSSQYLSDLMQSPEYLSARGSEVDDNERMSRFMDPKSPQPLMPVQDQATPSPGFSFLRTFGFGRPSATPQPTSEHPAESEATTIRFSPSPSSVHSGSEYVEGKEDMNESNVTDDSAVRRSTEEGLAKCAELLATIEKQKV